MLEQEQRISEYLFATIDARTERGGRVSHVPSTEIDGKRIALVGDTVSYDDGSDARIIYGAGFGMTWRDKPGARVRRHLDNGDIIISTRQHDYGIKVRKGESVPGLFDSAWRLHREVVEKRKEGSDA